MADKTSTARRRSGLRRVLLVDLVVLAVLGAMTTLFLSRHWGDTPADASHPRIASAPTTTTTLPPTTTTTTLPPPGPGFAAGHVTAVGDSVMLDYQAPLQTDIPGINVEASVSRQWSDGVQLVQQLKAYGQLGAEVIVGLGTNGPITDSDFDAMMRVLSGASRVVFVNVHVDRPWQDQNNAVFANGAARYPDVFVADWATLAAQNPGWFGADGTHLAIDGTGATALASLVTSTLTAG
jgi:hypothetical protein